MVEFMFHFYFVFRFIYVLYRFLTDIYDRRVSFDIRSDHAVNVTGFGIYVYYNVFVTFDTRGGMLANLVAFVSNHLVYCTVEPRVYR